MIVETPEIFKTKTNHNYPPGNDVIFEEYFFNNFSKDTIVTDKFYLPVLWTNFYISRGYATQDMNDLQIFLNQLPRDKKYFTIVQWDDGILNNIKDLDIKIFASGGVGDYPIPLINKPHNKVIRDKEIFASFVGNINGRHPIREKLKAVLENKSEYFISEPIGFNSFKEIMEKSIFSLCPRGYGKTSFRINESLNLGSIPVYIYDEPWIPFEDLIDFKEYGVLIKESEIENIDNILKNISEEDIQKLRKKGSEVYSEFYSYEGCYKQIIKNL